MNSYQHARPSPMPTAHHPDDAWVDPLFKLIVILVIGVLAAVLIPIAIVALVVFVAIKLLRIPWGIFFGFFLLLFFIFFSMDMSPIESLEKVFRKLMHVVNGKRAGELDFLLARIPHWWRLQFPEVISLGGMLGAILEGLLPLPAPPWHPKAEQQKQRAMDAARRDASLAVRHAPEVVRGVPVLGADIGGDLASAVRRDMRGRRWLIGADSFFAHPSLVVGQPGTGKTTSLLRIAYLATKVLGYRVYFLDGKGDVGTQRDFVASMLRAGLEPAEIGAFPHASFDGWRTAGREEERYTQLLSRLLAVVRSTEPYYEDTTRHFVARALKEGGSLPSSSSDLLARLRDVSSPSDR